MWECASEYAPRVCISSHLHGVDNTCDPINVKHDAHVEGIQKLMEQQLRLSLSLWMLFPTELRCSVQIRMDVHTHVRMSVQCGDPRDRSYSWASIWILLSEHMSGKSTPGNRIQAQMMSFYEELTCHLSDSPRKIRRLWGRTGFPKVLRGGKNQTVTPIKLHILKSFLTFQICVRNGRNSQRWTRLVTDK